MSFSLNAVNSHIVLHFVVAAGAIAFFCGAVFWPYALVIRLQMMLFGLVGVSWSAIGLYLLHHARDQHLSHTRLPWSQFWALDHIHMTLAGMALGILLCLFVNPMFYRRSTDATRSI